MSKKGIRILIIVAVVAVLFGFWMLFKTDSETLYQDKYASTPAPKEYTYVNERYEFSLKVPAGWSIYEANDGPSSIITLYKNKGQQAPQNYLDNSTHVTILPSGSQAGGIVPWESRIAKGDKFGTTTEYVLEDGTVWSKKLEFSPTPTSWQSWGFVFASVEVLNDSQKCIQANKEIPVRECNPLAGGILKRTGNVADSDMRDVQKILESFTTK